MDYSIRELTAADEAIVWEVLMYAACETSIESVRSLPALVRYASGWGRAGDCGCAAIEGKTLLGAVWLRLWPDSERGFGYMGDGIPELGLAVLPEYRGKGIGSALLARALAMAEVNYPAVSLSVRSDNPAIRLYERSGFVKLPDTQHPNRAGSTSFTMLRSCDRHP
jgi:ribosomal protein S18 acetylase RimI-like enzyme